MVRNLSSKQSTSSSIYALTFHVVMNFPLHLPTTIKYTMKTKVGLVFIWLQMEEEWEKVW